MVVVVCLPAGALFYGSTHNSAGLKALGVALEKQQLQCILVFLCSGIKDCFSLFSCARKRQFHK